ncbi:MAG: aldo/keto reductase [Alphaproteobacteria bacterium]|nr:aldo/keto reductase [Alphaproteobacteria bacterium]
MEFRNVGRSGLRVSLIGLGCNNLGGRIDLEASRKVVHRALDRGITFFDTADIYGNVHGHLGGSESALGQILADRRKDIVLATKFGMGLREERDFRGGGSRRYIVQAVEASLRRLRTDWIDLYQLHMRDVTTPIEETLRALDDLVHQGKVRYLGCSNLASWQVVEAQWTARHHGLNAFVSCQEEYSLLMRGIETDRMPVASAYGLGIIPYFPLASGLLTGKYQHGVESPAGTRFRNTPSLANLFMTPANWAKIEKLAAFAKARDRTLLELALSWLAARPQVSSIIAGATHPDQVDRNVAAVRRMLDAPDIAQVDEISA